MLDPWAGAAHHFLSYRLTPVDFGVAVLAGNPCHQVFKAGLIFGGLLIYGHFLCFLHGVSKMRAY
jgi:hypothetical protein